MKLNQPVLCRIIAKAAAMLLLCGLHANSVQGADDNALIYYTNGLVNFVSGDVIVGTNGVNNHLEVSNATTLTNSGDSYISQNVTASGNSALVSGSGSLWSTLGNMFVGSLGANATLIITNGGKVNTTGQALIGYYVYDSVSNNIAKVTGTGSGWNIGSTLYVGNSGHDDQLIIDNGGTVTNLGSTFIGNGGGSSNNLLFVTGSGSTFVQSGSDLGLGGGGNNKLVVANGGLFKSTNIRYSSPNGQVIVTNGGTIRTAGIIVGDGAGGIGDLFLLSGSGSTVTNSGPTYVGNAGASATLRIEKGGTYTNGTFTVMGNTAGSSNNLLVVTDAGSLYKSTSDFNLGGGGSNTVVVANGGVLTNGNFQFFNKNNQILITNGGTAHAFAILMGNAATAVNNRILVSGTGSVLNAYYTDYALLVGYNGTSGSKLQIEDGGVVNARAGNLYVGGLAALPGQSNSVSVSGSGSQLNINKDVYLGNGGATLATGNQITISNGAQMTVGGATHVGLTGADASLLTVTGNGSSLLQTGTLYVGSSANNGQLVITNGGSVHSFGEAAIGWLSSSNMAKVTGPGSTWTVDGELNVGRSGPQLNQLLIENGATVTVNNATARIGYVSSNNVMRVTGDGSAYLQTNGTLYVGFSYTGNQVVVTNGGKVMTQTAQISYGSSFGTVTVTDSGSVWSNTSTSSAFSIGGYTGSGGGNNTLLVKNGGAFYSGFGYTVGAGTDSNLLLVTSGGLVEGNSLANGGIVGNTHNSISNTGGIYQFTTATPSISPGVGTIAVLDGTVSFRSVSNAPTGSLAGMNYTGNNTFRLNNSSNAAVSTYNFTTGLGSSNYYRLELVNGGSRWQGANLNIGSGGSLLVSNANAAVITARVNSTGSILVAHSMVTYASNVVINGSYTSDPSTNTYLADVTVNQAGTLAGGAGDLFDFKKSLYIHSTNLIGFNLSQSAVEFSGGGIHTNAITGQDLGGKVTAFDIAFTYQTNFAYGELHLSSAADQICFECGNIPLTASNALYVGWLDLLTNASLVANLHVPTTINIYYSGLDTRNSYLGGQSYQLLDCNGALGGFLMPVIPEPSALLLIAIGAGWLAAPAVEDHVNR